MEVWEAMDFGPKWISWTNTLLYMASSIVFLNGVQGRGFKHQTELCEGDPQSPLLFFSALKPLQQLLGVAEQEWILQPVQNIAVKLRVSLYADDTAVSRMQPIKSISVFNLTK